jgi:hypothetical protein
MVDVGVSQSLEKYENGFLPGDVKFLKIISDKFKTMSSSLFVIVVFFLLASNRFKQYSRIDMTLSLANSSTDDTLNLHSSKLIEFIDALLGNGVSAMPLRFKCSKGYLGFLKFGFLLDCAERMLR